MDNRLLQPLALSALLSAMLFTGHGEPGVRLAAVAPLEVAQAYASVLTGSAAPAQQPAAPINAAKEVRTKAFASSQALLQPLAELCDTYGDEGPLKGGVLVNLGFTRSKDELLPVKQVPLLESGTRRLLAVTLLASPPQILLGNQRDGKLRMYRTSRSGVLESAAERISGRGNWPLDKNAAMADFQVELKWWLDNEQDLRRRLPRP
ncbi:MAG: hypothetical protein HY554_17585 [Elusimicrobia bacterium]|nr:hypothetical protein [Elusimicrobiota bacterium]